MSGCLQVFPQTAFAIGGLTASLGVGDRRISGFVAGGGCHLGCHWWCLIGGVGQGVTETTGVSTKTGFDLQTSFYAVLAVWLQLRSVCIIPLIRHSDEFLELRARRNVIAILSLLV